MASVGVSPSWNQGASSWNQDPSGRWSQGKPTSQFGNPGSFTAAANTQASDYDTIMKGYQDTINRFSNNPVTSTNVNPQSVQTQNVNAQQISPQQDIASQNLTPSLSKYSESGDVTKSLAGLSDLATTGGYSAQGIADIRARDVSPIRSIYGNAQENVDRQRALSGGYSPNFNATQAQMAADESNKISDVTTAANAGIAQNVAANRISASGTYAGASAAENAARTQSEQRNADIVNQINEANAQRGLQTSEFNVGQRTGANEFNASLASNTAEANANRALQANTGNAQRAFEASTGNAQRGLEAQEANRRDIFTGLEGQKSLYGTTPALTSTFGNQVVQAGQLGQGQQQIDLQKQRDLYGFAERYA